MWIDEASPDVSSDVRRFKAWQSTIVVSVETVDRVFHEHTETLLKVYHAMFAELIRQNFDLAIRP